MNIKINAILTLAAILAALYGAKAQQVGNYHIYDSTGREIVNTNWQGHVYTITLAGNDATCLCVDNKKIAPADLPKYDSIVARIVRQVRLDEVQGERDREQGARDREQGARDREQGARDREQAVHDQEQAAHDRAQADKDREQGERDREQAVRDQVQAAHDREQAVHDQEQAAHDREQAARDREQAERDRKQAAEDRENFRRLTALLVGKKLIPDAAGLKDLLLTDDELIINGKKASPEIHKEIKEKYSQWSHSGFSYNTNCNCASVHFHSGSR
jgi:hypothetical protein